MEVNEVYEYDYYEVTDLEEEEDLKKALNGEKPILTQKEIQAYFGND